VKSADLIRMAAEARQHARAPHSNFRVGAALESRSGKVYSGCNIENATYGLTVCAERVAIWKALSEGGSGFRRIAIVTDTDTLTPPCGACRQIIWEYCGDIRIVLANLQGKSARYRMQELFPVPFDNRFLKKEK
jgi:cytidine deaminase